MGEASCLVVVMVPKMPVLGWLLDHLVFESLCALALEIPKMTRGLQKEDLWMVDALALEIPKVVMGLQNEDLWMVDAWVVEIPKVGRGLLNEDLWMIDAWA
jgi:hypothetical protein